MLHDTIITGAII